MSCDRNFMHHTTQVTAESAVAAALGDSDPAAAATLLAATRDIAYAQAQRDPQPHDAAINADCATYLRSYAALRAPDGRTLRPPTHGAVDPAHGVAMPRTPAARAAFAAVQRTLTAARAGRPLPALAAQLVTQRRAAARDAHDPPAARGAATRMARDATIIAIANQAASPSEDSHTRRANEQIARVGAIISRGGATRCPDCGQWMAAPGGPSHSCSRAAATPDPPFAGPVPAVPVAIVNGFAVAAGTDDEWEVIHVAQQIRVSVHPDAVTAYQSAIEPTTPADHPIWVRLEDELPIDDSARRQLDGDADDTTRDAYYAPAAQMTRRISDALAAGTQAMLILPGERGRYTFRQHRPQGRDGFEEGSAPSYAAVVAMIHATYGTAFPIQDAPGVARTPGVSQMYWQEEA